MIPEHKIALLGFLFTLFALPFLLGGLRRMKGGDEAMYETLADDEPDYASPSARPVSPRRLRLLGAVLTLVFLSIAVSVAVTVMAATGSLPTGARCPF